MAENQTIRYLKDFKPDGILHVPGPLPGQIPPNRTPTFRLSWRSSPPNNLMDHAELARGLSTSLPDAQFFIDTCFIVGSELDDSLVDTLLRRRVVFTPLVFDHELRNWMTNSQVKNVRFRDIVSDARSNGHSSITFLDPTTWSPEHYATYQYYTGLLGLRKTLWTMLESDFQKKHQRAPSKQELHTYCQRYVHDR